MVPLPPIPDAFTAKKAAILASLSAPVSSYTDLSPKGTVDEAIRGLIDRINALEGLVTTSSCAGRLSVFLEGRKRRRKQDRIEDDGGDRRSGGEGQAAVPGGKGMGGRWLFVSHEPVGRSDGHPCRTFGLEAPKGSSWDVEDKEPNQLRFARFQFEPMILHVMTASLHHAQPILAAAINAGFRESGVQSLKNLDDAGSFPMVAIRSAGLALESVVGACHDHAPDNVVGEGQAHMHESKGANLDECLDIEDDYEDNETVCTMVSEEYCEMLRRLANERFKANTERMKRFEDDLFRRQAEHETNWEDSEARKERKRAEGLRKQYILRKEAAEERSDADEDAGQENGTLFGSLPVS